MRDLSTLESSLAAAILSFFVIHHLDPQSVTGTLVEWHRVLAPGGQLLVATSEGAGVIDYGKASHIIVVRYHPDELIWFARAAGFSIIKCRVDPVEDMPMDAIYLEAERA